MLDAAVPGAVFTSPTPDPILEATKAADHGAGVLHIVKNYTGDVLNFETAAEMAEMEDIEVRSIVEGLLGPVSSKKKKASISRKKIQK